MLNKLVFHVFNAAGYSCHKTANGLRHTADKVDALGNKCDRVAEKVDPFFLTSDKKSNNNK